MKRNEIGAQACPLAQSLARIGDSWSFLIIREALYGFDRFSDFVDRTGAQKTVVSARLKHLVESGVMEREIYDEFPVRHRYLLTEKGRDLAGAFVMLSEWGTRWADEGAEFAMEIVHECGHRLEPRIHCASCNEPVTPGSTTARVLKPTAL
ncbi:MAG: helix-turn-helix domain-containing protein [Actinomycetota bacterium]